MHLYFITRGSKRRTRRFVEELEDVYLNFKNKITGKKIGAVQICPREIKSWECVFPATEKGRIKDIIKEKASKLVTVHFGPFKKDKFKNGEEML